MNSEGNPSDNRESHGGTRIAYSRMEKCTFEEVCDEFGGDYQKFPGLIEKLREWLMKQPHLPKDVSHRQLVFFLLRSKLDLKKAEEKLDFYLSMSNIVPELYSGRNPTDPSIIEIRKIVQIIPLPNLSPEGYGVRITKILTGNNSTIDPWSYLKLASLMNEVLIEETLTTGDIIILDCENARFGQLDKFTVTFLKKMYLAWINGYCSRVKRIQLINAPVVVHRIVAICRFFIKPKIAARIHSSNAAALHEFLPKSILPADYGGDERSIAELSEAWYEKLLEYRELFLKQQTITVDERLRPGEQRDLYECYGLNGTFRNIELD